MPVLAMPRAKKAEVRQWGETKAQRAQILLTTSAIEALELLMERSRRSRSEIIERLVRGDKETQEAIAKALADVQAAQTEPTEG